MYVYAFTYQEPLKTPQQIPCVFAHTWWIKLILIRIYILINFGMCVLDVGLYEKDELSGRVFKRMQCISSPTCTTGYITATFLQD